MTEAAPQFVTSLARTNDDCAAAQSLRYQVFVEELGAGGSLVDHGARFERDRFDAYAEQLILRDLTRGEDDQVVGVYRLMDQEAADAAGQFYSEDEYDLGVLRASGRRILELGRSCLHPDYRGGVAMLHLWQALAQIVEEREVEILFGVASFTGRNPEVYAESLSILARDYLAPQELRVRSKDYHPMALSRDIDRLAAMKQMPALIKAYLRLGGYVGDGAFVDESFNTTDVCLILDIARMSPKQRALYESKGNR